VNKSRRRVASMPAELANSIIGTCQATLAAQRLYCHVIAGRLTFGRGHGGLDSGGNPRPSTLKSTYS